MKKLEGRAILCLLLVIAMLAGLVYFCFRLETEGGKWASFYANDHIYKAGHLTVGSIYDKNGVLLMKNTEDGCEYCDDADVRKSLLQVVGDPKGNVATAINVRMKSTLVGYDRILGVNGVLKSNGGKVNLTIDSDINKVAYQAMAGRDGFVSVYNWKTGEIECLVSTPTVDPKNSSALDNAPDGTFINKVLGAAYTPGSVFKLVTTAALLENKSDLDNWGFTCTGSTEIGGEKITCPYAHGTMDFKTALAKSCNCAFATLTVELGSDVMNEYVEKLGLTGTYDVDGIETKAGSFNFDTYDINLGWAGIGQFEDQVNPLSMMVYMGAIAGDGEAAIPTIVKDGGILEGSILPANVKTVKLLKENTAKKLQDLTRNNVIETYKDDNFPGLELHAKSGTAETIAGVKPHAWFVGYSGDHAFVVCVETGGYGSQVAGPIANKVLQAIVGEE